MIVLLVVLLNSGVLISVDIQIVNCQSREELNDMVSYKHIITGIGIRK